MHVPFEIWAPEGLSRIASVVGKPLHVDNMTASKKRITFARICIEVDAEHDLIKELDACYTNPVTGDEETVPITVQYQWIPIRCAKCNVFGHDCMKKVVKKTGK